MSALLVPLTIVLAITLAVVWRRQRTLRRETYIRDFELPKGLFETLRKQHPALTLKECQLVAHALRQFFLAYLKCGRLPVAMPSQIVDELWHAFILHTRAYERFCASAFGRFLHHTPAAALGSVRENNAGLRRVWWQSCREEHIDPRKPTRLPLLFALDAKLGVAGGFVYAADCAKAGGRDDGSGAGTVVHCGSELGHGDRRDGGSGSGCGSGSSTTHGCSSCSGGDGGGGGCGGGCGGGS
jgi:hypothetical protein